MRRQRRTIWFGPPGPSNRGLALAAVVAVTAATVAWRVSVVDRVPTWELRARAFRGTSGADLATRDALGRQSASTLTRESSRRDIVLRLPDWVGAAPVEWKLQVRTVVRPPGEPPRYVPVLLNGREVLRADAYGRESKTSIPSGAARQTGNELRLVVEDVNLVRYVRVSNYVALSSQFPKLGLFKGDVLTGPADVGVTWLSFPGGVLLVAAALAVFYGVACRPLRIPLFTRSQAIGLCAAQALALVAVAAVNLFTPYVVAITAWSAVLLAGAGWSVAAVILFFYNLQAMRFDEFAEETRRRWIERRWAAVVLGTLLAAYLSNGQRVGGKATEAAPLVAQSLIVRGDFDLDEFEDLVHVEQATWIMRTTEVHAKRDHYVSRWSPGSALAAVPFFLLPTLAGLEPGGVDQSVIAKFAAAVMSALSAAFVFAAVRRVASLPGAMLVTLAYALGTATWTTSSQDLWPHGPAQLGLAIGLWGILSAERRPMRHWLAAMGVSFSVVCHPPDVTLALGLVLYAGLRYGPGCWTTYFVGGLPAAAVFFGYNLFYFDSLWPAGLSKVAQTGFGGNPALGMLGVLASPNRGLLAYSPYVVFVAFGVWVALRSGESKWRRFGWCMAPAMLLSLVVYGAWKPWPTASPYSCRYAVDGMVFGSLFLAMGVDRILAGRAWRAVFVLLVGVSVLLHGVAVYRSPLPWPSRPAVKAEAPAAAAWDVRDLQIVSQVKHALRLGPGD